MFSHNINILNAILQQQKEIIEKQGFSVETRIVLGDTKHELNRIAIEGKYSLFVVGSRGYSLVGEAFLGGVANDVMHHAYMPVLLLLINWPCGLDGGLLAYVFFQGCSTGARAKMACNELASAVFKAKFLRMNIKELVVALQTEQLKGKSVFKQSEAATR